MIRHQLPARSPLRLSALLHGLTSPGGARDRLGAQIASDYGATRYLLVDSGTSALALSFLACASGGSRPSVALPAYACFDLMTAADAVDAEVLLYDLDPTTLGPAQGEIARVLGLGARAVVAAHWYGFPVDLDPLREATRAAGALLIEDAAQALGVVCRGRPAGTIGDFGVLSFGRGKGRTGGGGGVLLANDSVSAASLERVSGRLAQAPRDPSAQAALLAQWALGRPWLYVVPAALPFLGLGETAYRRPHPPAGMPARAAAIVLALWCDAELEVAARRNRAAAWDRELAGVDAVIRYTAPADTTPGWLRFPVLARPGRETVLRSPAMRRRGVMPGYPRTLDELPVGPDRLAAERSALHGARRLTRQLFTLPSHGGVTPGDVRSVCQRLHGEKGGSRFASGDEFLRALQIQAHLPARL
ncbi:MAG: DegT/DnrJ/EryC1/StrS family aminotransferase [Gemmatimonadales bacterium]